MLSREPSPVQNTDEVLACPLCGADKPSISVRLLRSVVKRKSRWVAVIDGETMQCLKCGGQWSYGYRTGVFDRSRVQITDQRPQVNAEEAPLPPPPVTRLKPRERLSSV